jgi:hypothetical protein
LVEPDEDAADEASAITRAGSGCTALIPRAQSGPFDGVFGLFVGVLELVFDRLALARGFEGFAVGHFAEFVT